MKDHQVVNKLSLKGRIRETSVKVLMKTFQKEQLENVQNHEDIVTHNFFKR